MFTVVEKIIKSADPIPGPVKEITGSSGSLLLMREAVTADQKKSDIQQLSAAGHYLATRMRNLRIQHGG